jgi:MFS family permease
VANQTHTTGPSFVVTQADLSKHDATLLATGNYLGYLIGALLGIAVTGLARRRAALRLSGMALVATLVVMPLTHAVAVWLVLRGVAGVASAVIFMVAGNAILSELVSRKPHAVGWAYGGVGAGIAASGVLVAVVKSIGDWQVAWWSSAALAAVFLAVGWSVGEQRATVPDPDRRTATSSGPTWRRAHHVWFGLLAGSYFLEGTGYIIAGTFLVAAVDARGPGWLSGAVWTIVGLAAVPSCALWTWLSTRMSRPSLITGALLLQAIGIALRPSHPGGTSAGLGRAVRRHVRGHHDLVACYWPPPRRRRCGGHLDGRVRDRSGPRPADRHASAWLRLPHGAACRGGDRARRRARVRTDAHRVPASRPTASRGTQTSGQDVHGVGGPSPAITALTWRPFNNRSAGRVYRANGRDVQWRQSLARPDPVNGRHLSRLPWR